MSNGWDEHQNEVPDAASDFDDAGVLEPALGDVPIEEIESARTKESRGGFNPRLMAVLLMVVVIGGSGFMYMRMKNQNAARAAEPFVAAPLDSAAPTQPQSNDLLGQGGLYGGVPSGEGASAGLLPTNPVSADVYAQTAAPAMQPQPSASSDPEQPSGDQQVASLKQTISSMELELSRLANQNNQLMAEKEDLARAQAQSAATKPSQGQVPVRAKRTEKKVATTGAAPRGKRSSKNDEIITEKRESRFAEMSVRAIYPLNGRNARAWINIGNDVVEVSAGSTVAGAYVKSINPDSMEVMTDAGVIRANR